MLQNNESVSVASNNDNDVNDNADYSGPGDEDGGGTDGGEGGN